MLPIRKADSKNTAKNGTGKGVQEKLAFLTRLQTDKPRENNASHLYVNIT